jgi:hypothetical protein
MSQHVRIELLLGRVVRDATGRRIGRIEEMRAARRGPDWVVTHFLLGPTGWRARLSLDGVRFRLSVLQGRRRTLKDIESDALDLSDPLHPRLR